MDVEGAIQQAAKLLARQIFSEIGKKGGKASAKKRWVDNRPTLEQRRANTAAATAARRAKKEAK